MEVVILDMKFNLIYVSTHFDYFEGMKKKYITILLWRGDYIKPNFKSKMAVA